LKSGLSWGNFSISDMAIKIEDVIKATEEAGF